MKDFLPLFPLNLVAFPGERLNLHIFEPRYKQLFRECQENQITFGIPTYIDGKIMNLGTELRLEAIEKSYASGELDVKTFGIGIFRIDEFYSQAPNKLYAGADIERLTLNTEEKDPILNEKIYAFLKDLFGTLDIAMKKIPKDAQSFISYDIAHHVGFSVEQEYQLLSMETELERQSFIYNHLQNIVPVAKEMENLKERALLNGHFKKIIPPSI
jgi:Lon protease-like protein